MDNEFTNSKDLNGKSASPSSMTEDLKSIALFVLIAIIIVETAAFMFIFLASKSGCESTSYTKEQNNVSFLDIILSKNP